MRPDIQVLLSGALTFGVPLLLAVRELLVLNRDPAPPAADDDPDSEPSSPLLPPCPMLEARADSDGTCGAHPCARAGLSP